MLPPPVPGPAVQVHDGDDLHLVPGDAVEHGVGEPVEDEPSSDPGLDLGEPFRRLGDGIDALFDRDLKPLGGARVSREIPEERGASFGLRTLFDAELPAGHALLAGEDACLGLVPGREPRAPGVDVGETLAHFVAPRALDLGLGLADAVEELERKDGALLVGKRLCILEELVGSPAHAESVPAPRRRGIGSSS